MRKIFIIALMALCLCSCAVSVSPESDTTAKTTSAAVQDSAAETQAAPQAAPTSQETSAEVQTEAVKANEQTSSEQNAPAVDYDKIVTELLAGTEKIDMLCCSVLSVDDSFVYQYDNGIDYFLVTDPEYTALSDISELLDSCVTQNLRESGYSELIDTNSPLFIENDGMLYMSKSGKGGDCVWSSEPSVLLSDDENSFTVTKAYTEYDYACVAKITVVNTDNGWRIDVLEKNYTAS